MALTFPRDMVSTRKWETADFWLTHRQEISRTEAGAQVRDRGPSLWRAKFATPQMPRHDADAIMADFSTLGGALRPFYLVPMDRPIPASAVNGTDLGNCAITAVRADRGALRFNGLPTGFVMTPGDYLSVLTAVGGREVHQIVTGGSASSTGLTPWMEVVPAIRPGVQVDDFVKVNLPYVEMRLNPGTLERAREGILHARVAFEATQVVR